MTNLTYVSQRSHRSPRRSHHDSQRNQNQIPRNEILNLADTIIKIFHRHGDSVEWGSNWYKI
jgi:hypothetical protein